MISLIVSGCVVFATHALEAITGFGCTVLALPFITALLGIQTGVMTLTALAWILALYIAIAKRTLIDFKQYGIIISFTALGLPAGMYLFRSVDTALFKKILAVFITLSSAWQLYRLLRVKTPPSVEKKTGFPQRLPYFLLLFMGGIIHGMFSSGGPLVVLYASKNIPDKGAFRATLCLLWASLNTIIIAGYFFDPALREALPHTAKTTAYMLPALIAGIIGGEWIHGKVRPRVFSLTVFTTLLITGVFMLF